MEKYFFDFQATLAKYPYLKTVILSTIVLVFLYLLKRIITRGVTKNISHQTEKIHLSKKINQYFTIIAVPTLVFLWFSHLQVFFVSVVAVAAAVVIAFKELIMCLTGGVLVKTSSAFKEGHRICIDDIRGFVIEKNLLTTKVLEIGPEKNSQQTTGNIITIPNSMMLSNSVKNESYFRGYSIKSFIFKIPDLGKAAEFESDLLSKGEELCAPYIQDAQKGINKLCNKEGIVIPSVEAKTKVLVEEEGDIKFLLKLPVRSSGIAGIEQELNRFYLRWISDSSSR